MPSRGYARSKRRNRAALCLTAAAATVGLLAQPAVALSPDGFLVSRSCGVNKVFSYNVTNEGRAETVLYSGNCNSTLSAAVIYAANGEAGARRAGNTSFVRASTSVMVSGGLHWGCPTCNQTRS